MREGAFLGSGLAISTTGVETAREREQNARKDALTVVTRRVCMRYESYSAQETRLSVEDGIAGQQRPERNILAIALLVILVLQVSTTYRLEEVRNAKTKSCQCRPQKLFQGQLKTGGTRSGLVEDLSISSSNHSLKLYL